MSGLWETLTSAQQTQPQNNGWNHSDDWGQKKPDYPSRKRSRSKSPFHHKNRYVRGVSRSPRNNSRKFMDRGEIRREESRSPPNYGRNATREPCRDLRRGSWSNGKNNISRREASEPDRDEKQLGNERCIQLLQADASKRQGSFLNNRTEVGNENQPGLLSPCMNPLAPNDDNKHVKKRSIIDKEYDEWGVNYTDIERNRSRSLSPWSQAVRNVNDKSDSEGTNGWGKDHDQTGTNAWNQTKSNDLLPNDYSTRQNGGHRISTEEEKWKRSEQHNGSRCREQHSISPENRPSRTGCGRGRSRGRGNIDSRSHNRYNRRQGLSPYNNKTKYGREEHLEFSSPKRNRSDQNENAAFDKWDASSPKKNESRSVKNSIHKEYVGWDLNSSPMKTPRSRSGSPWSKAAFEIDKNYYNGKEIDGWGAALEQNGDDAWNQPRSNISVDRGFRRRGGSRSRDQNLSPAPNYRRAEKGMNRSRCRESSYSPDNIKIRSVRYQGRFRYRGNHAGSPRRSQDRRERKYHSHSPCYQEGERRRDGSESRYAKKTCDAADATKVTSSDGSKWHDWSVNDLRSSLRDPHSIFNWGHPTNTGVGGRSMDIQDAYYRTEQGVATKGQAYSLDRKISSENQRDVKEIVVNNSPGIEPPLFGTPYLPLSYDPWDNDACIAPSHPISTLLVNPTSSHQPQPLSNNQNPNLISAPWGLSAAPFKYPTLESKTNLATASSFSDFVETKKSCLPLVPSDGGAPLMPVLIKSPAMANGVTNITATPNSASLPQKNLAPLLPTTNGTVGLASSSLPEAIFSNTNSATKIGVLSDTNVRTSCTRGTHTVAGMPKTNQNIMPVARSSEPNIDPNMQTISCTINESDAKSELSAVGAQLNKSSQPSQQNHIMQNKRGADWVEFSNALVHFAKPTVKRYWVNGLITDASYKEVLDKFWSSIYNSLGAAAPQTDDNIRTFIRQENDSLSKHLQVFLNKYLSRAS